MKLLFDQNLSFRLCRLLDDAFPDSSQIRLLGMESAEDQVIWNYAKANDLIIVSQDVDFAEWRRSSDHHPRSFGFGAATNHRM